MTETDWLGGITLDSIPENIFETYERSMVPAVFKPWGEKLVDEVGLHLGECVLDLACATGIVARIAAARVGKTGSVTGLDLMAGMLDEARRASQNIQPAIEWVEGNVNEMPLPDASFDVVLCQQGFQFFPDKLAALEEIRRVMADRGRVALSVWRSIEHSPAVAVLQDAVEQNTPEVAGFLPMAFSLTDADELRRLLSETGFSEISVRIGIASVRFASVAEFLTTYLGSTPLGGMIASMPAEKRGALAEAVASSLAHYVDDDGLTFPQETTVAIARS